MRKLIKAYENRGKTKNMEVSEKRKKVGGLKGKRRREEDENKKVGREDQKVRQLTGGREGRSIRSKRARKTFKK